MNALWGSVLAMFVLGLVQSIGPCVFNRVVTLSALTATSRSPWFTAGVFLLGVIGGYEVFLVFAPFMELAYAHLSIVYAVTAGVFVAGAFLALRASVHEHECSNTQYSHGGVFMVGVGSVFALQPCCLPVIFGIVASSAYVGFIGAGLLFLAYGIGHAIPLMVVAFGSVRMRGIIERFGAMRGLAYVNAGLLLFMAVYFGVQV